LGENCSVMTAPGIVFPFNLQPLNNAPFNAVEASQSIMVSR